MNIKLPYSFTQAHRHTKKTNKWAGDFEGDGYIYSLDRVGGFTDKSMCLTPPNRIH